MGVLEDLNGPGESVWLLPASRTLGSTAPIWAMGKTLHVLSCKKVVNSLRGHLSSRQIRLKIISGKNWFSPREVGPDILTTYFRHNIRAGEVCQGQRARCPRAHPVSEWGRGRWLCGSHG